MALEMDKTIAQHTLTIDQVRTKSATFAKIYEYMNRLNSKKTCRYIENLFDLDQVNLFGLDF
jgi:hypothetical protein